MFEYLLLEAIHLRQFLHLGPHGVVVQGVWAISFRGTAKSRPWHCSAAAASEGAFVVIVQFNMVGGQALLSLDSTGQHWSRHEHGKEGGVRRS